jgi:hypothetical protein
VARALQAAPAPSSEPWASVRSVLFDGEAEQRTLAIAGQARRRRSPRGGARGLVWHAR